MVDIHGIGSFGIVPFLTDEIQNQKFREIKTQAGRIAYLLSLGKNRAKKPHIKEGVYEARGALKWIASVLEEKDNKEEENEK